MARKNFVSKDIGIFGDGNNKIDYLVQFPPIKTKITFPQHPGSLRTFDFSPYYGKNCDQVVYECQRTIESLLSESIKSRGNTLTAYSIACYCNRGLKIFLPFCHLMTTVHQKELTLQDIDKDFINSYIKHLSERGSQRVTQKNIYTLTKSVLQKVATRGLLSKNIFPKNPFPSINRQKRGEKSLSKTERKDVALALKGELGRIQSEDGQLSSYDLSICVLAIALRTGLNPTPILELTTDCLKQHPIKRNRRLLVSYKRRGRNTQIHTLRKTEDIEKIKTVIMDVCLIVEMITQRNIKVREKSEHTEILFVFESAGGNRGAVCRLSENTLHKSVKAFVEQNQLINCDGETLVLNVMRLRKTFENRIWELSGQDPFVTAAMAGHSVKVSNDHYLEAPAEAEKNWRLMGEIRNKELLGNKNSIHKSDKENTPIAGCKDSKYGHFAPKNGSHCVRFMSCFRCRSFVATEDDLYRMLSFYWLLVSERKLIGAKRWGQYYAHIIRIIDSQILPHFNQEKVLQTKENAKINPHPYWRSSEQLELVVQ